MSNTEHARGLSGRLRHAIVLTVLFALQMQSVAPAWAQQQSGAPAQSPLLIRDGNQPKPNVMLTLDTSWSMIFPFAPEGTFTPNPGHTEATPVKFPGFTSVIMHPDDPRHDPGAPVRVRNSAGVIETLPAASVGDGGVIPADPGNIRSANPKIFPIQMRSPDVNTIYYDPRVRYRPWLQSKDTDTGAETRYCQANPTQAFFTPNKVLDSGQCPASTTAAANLTEVTDYSAASTNSPYWCDTPPTQDVKLSCTKAAQRFNPGLYFLLNRCGDANNVNCYTQYNINPAGNSETCVTTRDGSSSNSTCYIKYPERTDCAGTSCTQAEERQNFANWFVYYRTRLHVAQASIPEAFLQNPGSIRVGWATIHGESTTIDGVDSMPFVQQGVRNFNSTIKSNMVDWIRNFSSDKNTTVATTGPKLRGGTPLRLATLGVGNYFARRDARSPWANDPSSTPSTTIDPPAPLACRRSYHVLVTDGYYNDATDAVNVAMKQSMALVTRTTNDNDPYNPQCPVDASGTTCLPDATLNEMANQDGSAGPAIVAAPPDSTTFQYAPAAPYRDNLSYTLADAAMLFWKHDLRPGSDFPNIVPSGSDVPSDNPAFWQHLVQFPIGLGVSGSLDVKNWRKLLNTLSANNHDWWAGLSSLNQVSGSSPLRIDDLVHAAVNTRGRYFSANTATQLSNAIQEALTLTNKQSGVKESGVAVNIRPTGSGGSALKIVPQYTTREWSGNITAYALNDTGTAGSTPVWDAASKRPAAGNRKIFTSTAAGATEFQWASVNTDNAYVNALASNKPDGVDAASLLNYIRGDTSQELGGEPGGSLRPRNGTLPDFINSTPVYAQGNVNLRYELLPTATHGSAAGSYAAFLNQKASRPPLLFMGSNGGMVHAFAITAQTPNNVQAGQEVFAYVPRAVVPKLGLIAREDYGQSTTNMHQALVDGPQTETDAYLNGEWRNLLVGTFGAGGRGLYAIEVPKSGSTSLGVNSVWLDIAEADLGESTREKMGYMLGAPQVGVLPDGRWMLFVGNGPYSDSGQASLLAIDLATKAVSTIATDTTGNNGLGAVTLLKNTQQQVIGIYAGDLQGNVWRFPVSTPSGTGDTAAASTIGQGIKLFTAEYTSSSATVRAQPITAAPVVVPHPLGGYMVVIGTGKLQDVGDNNNTDVQSIYGLWDKYYREDGTGASAFAGIANPRGSALVQQTISSEPIPGTPGGTYFKSSTNPVKYSRNAITVDDSKLGWYMDLTISAGQRLVYESTLIRDFVLLNTVAPAPASNIESCEKSLAKGYNFLLPALDGVMSSKAILDTNGDGIINGLDAPASGYETTADGTDTVIRQSTGPDGETDPCAPISGTAQNTTGAERFQLPPGCSTSKIKSRIWRQLVNPPRP